jgi:Fe-coproporphyrin III synthase
MVGEPVRQRVLQVHPSLRCNLSCHHCYSSSGPQVGTMLDIGDLWAAVEDAAGIGYETLALSGGEPLLYPDLVPLAEVSREVGDTHAACSRVS